MGELDTLGSKLASEANFLITRINWIKDKVLGVDAQIQVTNGPKIVLFRAGRNNADEGTLYEGIPDSQNLFKFLQEEVKLGEKRDL